TLADHRAVQALNPDDAGARELVLSTLVEMGQVAEAETGIAAALAANPADIGALTVKVDIETGRGAPAAALPALDAGVEAAPDDEALRLLRAELRAATGDLDAAAADLAHVRDQHASDPEMLNNLCWTQATAGFALDQALADCDAAIALLPGQAALIDSRAMVLLQLGRLEEARAAYDEALRLAPTQTASLYGRGLVRQAMGDAGGEADLAAALAQDPDAAEDFKAWIARRDAAPAMAAE
ncbi:MAG: tetratricopeptide repeat protein, partial [Alphaproteobacteria bacterium]|nr:tetratricopeptide repeat protein [Alphaproteobacteria bacterium]